MSFVNVTSLCAPAGCWAAGTTGRSIAATAGMSQSLAFIEFTPWSGTRRRLHPVGGHTRAPERRIQKLTKEYHRFWWLNRQKLSLLNVLNGPRVAISATN